MALLNCVRKRKKKKKNKTGLSQTSFAVRKRVQHRRPKEEEGKKKENKTTEKPAISRRSSYIVNHYFRLARRWLGFPRE